MTKRIGHFVQIWLQEMNFFQKMTHKIDCFWIWLTELNLFFFKKRKELNPYQNTTRRIIFLIWLKRIDFWKMSQIIEPFLNLIQFFLKKKNISKKLNPSLQHYLKNWTHFFEFDSKNWTFFDQNYDSKHVHSPKKMTQRIQPFFEHDSRNWCFLGMTQRFFSKIWH